MLESILLVLIGFALLYFGAGWLIKGASSLAIGMGISKLVVGLTLVAMGTSSPELFVNITAALKGNIALALSNVSGSNLTNILVGFGLCALVGSVALTPAKFRIDLLYVAATPLLVLGFFLFTANESLPLWAIAPLIIMIVVYGFSLYHRPAPEEKIESGLSVLKATGLFLVGAALLYAGGEFVVSSAITLGKGWGLSDAVIGLTIVAFGTSIPDVMTSVIAVKRGENSLAVGNLLGSNISNVLLVLGGTLVAARSGLPSNGAIQMDYAMVCLISIVLLGAAYMWKALPKVLGGLFLVIYLSYMIFRLFDMG
ncbi:MAG: sodium:calcium antiporter [candidate division Zixibacteria bacterium]|nr:sodium:calcium antiporter [candidate division Zixibacteria bacterium]